MRKRRTEDRKRSKRGYTRLAVRALRKLSLRDGMLCLGISALYWCFLTLYLSIPSENVVKTAITPVQNKPDIYVCYILHFYDEKYMDEMAQIRNDTLHHSNYRYFWLFDASGSPFLYHQEASHAGWEVQVMHSLEVDKYIPAKSDSFYRVYYGKGKKLAYTHVGWLPYWASYAENVEHIWTIEFDTKFHGNWDTFFGYYDDNDADIIAFKHEKHGQDTWGWWRSCPTCKRGNRLKAFYPIGRYSTRFLRYMYARITENGGMKTGHHEAFATTLCFTADWCRVELIDERFVGKVHWRPTIRASHLARIVQTAEPGKFYHPVKD